MRKLEPGASKVLKALQSALKALPDANVNRARVTIDGRGTYAPTAAFHVRLGERTFVLMVEAMPTVNPRDVERCIAILQDYAAQHTDGVDTLILIAARRVSKLAREALEAARTGYFDESGALFLLGPQVYIARDGTAPPEAKCNIGSFLQPHRARVIEHMLKSWPKWLAVKDISSQCDVSPAAVSVALKLMGQMGWLEIDGAGPMKLRRFIQPQDVLKKLSSYSADLPAASMQYFHVPDMDGPVLARRLAEICKAHKIHYAITGTLAAQSLAQMPGEAPQVICRIEGGQHYGEVLRKLGARPVRKAWNFGVLAADHHGHIETGECINGVVYAPVFRVFLDVARANHGDQDVAAQLARVRFGM